MSVLLFGKRPPKKVDRRKHPKLGKSLRKLECVKDPSAELLGHQGKEFPRREPESPRKIRRKSPGNYSRGVRLDG